MSSKNPLSFDTRERIGDALFRRIQEQGESDEGLLQRMNVPIQSAHTGYSHNAASPLGILNESLGNIRHLLDTGTRAEINKQNAINLAQSEARQGLAMEIENMAALQNFQKAQGEYHTGKNNAQKQVDALSWADSFKERRKQNAGEIRNLISAGYLESDGAGGLRPTFAALNSQDKNLNNRVTGAVYNSLAFPREIEDKKLAYERQRLINAANADYTDDYSTPFTAPDVSISDLVDVGTQENYRKYMHNYDSKFNEAQRLLKGQKDRGYVDDISGVMSGESALSFSDSASVADRYKFEGEDRLKFISEGNAAMNKLPQLITARIRKAVPNIAVSPQLSRHLAFKLLGESYSHPALWKLQMGMLQDNRLEDTWNTLVDDMAQDYKLYEELRKNKSAHENNRNFIDYQMLGTTLNR